MSGRAKKAIMQIRADELERERQNLLNTAQGELEKEVAQAAMEHDDPKQYLDDVRNHGCQSGCATGMVYYRDTVAFYDRHTEEIWEMLYNDHQSTGEGDNLVAFIGGLNGAANVGSDEQFKNLLAWFAYERAADQILTRLESESDG